MCCFFVCSNALMSRWTSADVFFFFLSKWWWAALQTELVRWLHVAPSSGPDWTQPFWWTLPRVGYDVSWLCFISVFYLLGFYPDFTVSAVASLNAALPPLRALVLSAVWAANEVNVANPGPTENQQVVQLLVSSLGGFTVVKCVFNWPSAVSLNKAAAQVFFLFFLKGKTLNYSSDCYSEPQR